MSMEHASDPEPALDPAPTSDPAHASDPERASDTEPTSDTERAPTPEPAANPERASGPEGTSDRERAADPASPRATAHDEESATAAAGAPALTPTSPALPRAGGITAHGLRRSFGNVHAVVDVSFQAHPGQITALVGPNGSGKTTLLLLLASLLAPDAGSMSVGGMDPAADAQGVRAILGWMPDALGAWPSLTARETLVTTARMYRMPRAVASARAQELLTLVRLDDLADAPARVFSRGQKQRLGLARALVNDPAVLLLDEPASGLDPQSRVDLRLLLRRLADDGRTILISSHVLSELDELADAAIFLRAGRTVTGEPLAAAPTRMREWRIRALDRPGQPGTAAVIAALTSVDPPATPARRERNEIIASFDSEASAAHALAHLIAMGVRITEFAPVTGRLEQAFLDLNAEDAS